MDQPAKKNLIKVKGKDGTISYLTYEEFKARKSGKAKQKDEPVAQTVAAPEPVAPVAEEKVEEPQTEIPQSVEQTQPTESAKEVEASQPEPEIQPNSAISWSAEDHDSLLNAELEDHETHNVGDKDAYDYRRLVDQVMQDLNVPVAPELQMNVRALIDSYIRGVRDKHHVHELAVRDTASGGLGLSDANAARIIVLIEDKLEGHHRQLKKAQKAKPKKSITREIDHSAVRKGMELTTTVPVDHVFEDMARAKLAAQEAKKTIVEKNPQASAKSSIPEDVAKKLEAHYEMPVQKPIRTPAMANKMQDMQAPVVESVSMGPVEEMKHFTLVDFRRLSNDPARAVEKFAEKLHGWKEESYLLYLEARQAWFESPLYKEFQNVMISALNEQTSLQDYMRQHAEKDKIHLKEFNAMVELSGQLAV